MAAELHKGLHQILQKVDGLYGIILSDRDGVTILKAHVDPPPSSPSSPGTPFPESILRVNFLATFSTATEQASKLGMGRNEKIISIYQKFQIIQFNKLPVVVTLIAKKDANTGFLLTTIEELLSPLVVAVRKDVSAYYNSHLLNAGES